MEKMSYHPKEKPISPPTHENMQYPIQNACKQLYISNAKVQNRNQDPSQSNQKVINKNIVSYNTVANKSHVHTSGNLQIAQLKDRDAFRDNKIRIEKSLPKMKQIKQLMKNLKASKSQIKLLKESPYCQFSQKKKIIDSLMNTHNHTVIQNKIRLLTKNKGYQSPKSTKDKVPEHGSYQLSSQKVAERSSKEPGVKIQVNIKHILNQFKKNRNSHFHESSHKKRQQGMITESYDFQNSYIELSLVKCMNSQGKISKELITENLMENIKEILGYKDIVPVRNIMGYEIQKSFCGFSTPNEQTLTYMMSLNQINPTVLLNSHEISLLNKVLFRIKPIFFKISNIAAAIMYSKSQRKSIKNKQFDYHGSRHSSQKKELTPKFSFTINDFKIIQCLGSGGFSTVYLARGNFNSKYYAMKLIDKKFILESDRKAIVSSERFILEKLSHNLQESSKNLEKRECTFFTNLEFSFETENHFVFVIEYCPGGQLFNRLKSVKKMSQEEAKFYFLEILVALDYIHGHNIVYRDLKPENLLIDHEGHIKIADFGLSKYVEEKKELSYSFCGSPEYMAPEMLTKQGHNYLLDYYCLGALLYELVIGVPPYYSLNQEQIYESILTQQLSFPSHVQLSSQIKSLLSSLLKKQSRHRLGSMHGIKEIMAHPWVGRIKIDKITKRQLQPPYVPDLSLFNFDLQDIKSNLEDIQQLLEQDRKHKKFETCFSDEFSYTNEKEFQMIIEQLSSVQNESQYSSHRNKENEEKSSISSNRAKKQECLSLRSRTYRPLNSKSTKKENIQYSSLSKKNILTQRRPQYGPHSQNRSLNLFLKEKNSKAIPKKENSIRQDRKQKTEMTFERKKNLMRREVYMGAQKNQDLEGVKRITRKLR